MLPVINWDYEKILADLGAYSRNLAAVTKSLREIRDSDVRVGVSPKDCVAEINGKTLYRIRRPDGERAGIPLLVVYALVGSYTILDLQDDRSFVGTLSNLGLDVYVIDWGHPDRGDQFDDLGDYVHIYLDHFVDAVRRDSGQDVVNLIGVCQGGMLSLCYTATHGAKVRNLVLCVAPVDFHGDMKRNHPAHGFMNVWARGLKAEDVGRMVDTLGTVPGEIGGVAFSMMTPLRSLTKYTKTLVDSAVSEASLMNFLAMEKWLADRPGHPGAAARQWLVELYQDNRLIDGRFELQGEAVDLKNVTVPVLNIFTKTDHIIPPDMTTPLGEYIGSSDYTLKSIVGGHIGMFVSKRSMGECSAAVFEWLKDRTP